MTTRLKKRGTLALIIYFLMITAVCAPVAFFAGKAQGKVEADAANPLSQNDPDLRAEYAALYRARRAGAGCGGETDPDTERRAVWEIICHPYTEGAGGRAGQHTAFLEPKHITPDNRRAPGAALRSPRGPLDDVMVAAIAAKADPVTGALGAPGAGTLGSPLSLALAPDFGVSYDGHTLAGTGFGGGLSGGPNAPGGLPGNIIPDIQTAFAGPTPDTPTVVTPVPAALPLLLTGLAGLFAAAKHRKSATRAA